MLERYTFTVDNSLGTDMNHLSEAPFKQAMHNPELDIRSCMRECKGLNRLDWMLDNSFFTKYKVGVMSDA